MKACWLGGAGVALRGGDIRIMVDPVLTREEQLRALDILGGSPDVLILTHTHPDALDIDSVEAALSGTSVTVLASEGAYERVKELGGEHNYVLLEPGSVWSTMGVTFYAVPSAHSDRTAIGVIADDGHSTYYFSGDTLYNYDVIDACLELAPDGVDVAFLPISGRDCNMNAKDAADFAYEISAGVAVPVRHGSASPRDFDFEDALVLTPFEVREL